MNLVRLLALFLSKSGAIVVGVLFLPLYHKQLGSEAFGTVAVILSMQAFAMMVDFGMTVLIARDVAHVAPGSPLGWTLWRQAETAVVSAYAALLLLGLLACALMGLSGTQVLIVAGCMLLFLFTVLQNLGYTGLLARRRFVTASTVQVVGIVFRAAATVMALSRHEASVLTFVLVQAGVTALHFAVTHLLCRRALADASARRTSSMTWTAVADLMRRGRPLLVSGLAGAAVLQLDKPLISAFNLPGEVSPYFLAMSFSILPTSLLGTPVVQYFQPQVIRLLEASDEAQANRTIARFTLTLILVVAVPSWALWQWMAPVIHLWLRSPEQALAVAGYARILLPAFALGSLCFVPVVLLMAAQDFRYQATSSVLMTGGTLGLVFACAAVHRVDWACYAYLLYFVAASISVWWRALSLPATRRMARFSAMKSALPIALLVLIAAAFAAGT